MRLTSLLPALVGGLLLWPALPCFAPNEKEGPTGDTVFIDQELVYAIHFENSPQATAAVQRLVVIDFLDPNLDWTTLRPGPIRIADRVFDPPDEPFPLDRVIRGIGEGNRWDLAIQVNFDFDLGILRWSFQTRDPITGGIPLDPRAGFLPPNDARGRGEGTVSLRIRPRLDLAERTEIRNSARIQFDRNPAIQTNEVIHKVSRKPVPTGPDCAAEEPPQERTVCWVPVPGARLYRIFLWEEGTERPLRHQEERPPGSECLDTDALPLPPGTMFNFQVVAVLGDGSTLEGKICNLGTSSVPLPGVPTNPSPADGAFEVELLPELSWDTVPNADAYELFLWRDGDGKPGAPVAVLVEPRFQISGGLNGETLYRWQVVAANLAGRTSGEVWVFRTSRRLTGRPFVRGDVNASGSRDISDAIFILSYLFLGTSSPPCLKAADLNDDGQLNLTDPIYLLTFLFLAGPSPMPPDDGCGPDPNPDNLSCDEFGSCP